MYTCPSTEARLNMAEIERSVKSHQCLDRRKREKADLEREVAAWLAKFHAQVVCINWPFITAEAHIKFKRLSPSLAD